MAGVIGRDGAALRAACAAASDNGSSVEVANVNSPGQLIVSGARDAIERFAAHARAAGARRILPLNVGGPFPSVYMRPAAATLASASAETRFNPARIPVVLRLAGKGAGVVVNYNPRADAATSVADAIKTLGCEVSVVQADVARQPDVERLIRTALEAFSRIDIVVNNAGITRDTLLMRMSEDDWDTVLDTNLKSAFLVTKAALRPMLRQRHGRIVNITSISGVIGNAGQANYSASKAGLIGFTRSTAREVASRDITCNAVAAGVIDTEIWQGVPESAIESLLQMIPAGRKGTPEDVAEAVAFLASDAAAYITGQVLNVDGGLVMA